MELDMTDSSHQCPRGFRQRTDPNIRTCVGNIGSFGCSSVHYSTAEHPLFKSVWESDSLPDWHYQCIQEYKYPWIILRLCGWC